MDTANKQERQYRDRPEPIGAAQTETGFQLKVPTLLEQLEERRERLLNGAAELSKAIQMLKRHPELEETFRIVTQNL